ncbi:hypothetical protein [Hydrogenoanaerobacterium sp.]|uniref:hypothetical protein n=1 Tax=Hydrogenoanaerobacterium sp. TaxID=2953763 RepID=UPI0028992F35|nr:hypothetical protein [Hydrogenoanaerobacterium sp.]
MSEILFTNNIFAANTPIHINSMKRMVSDRSYYASPYKFTKHKLLLVYNNQERVLRDMFDRLSSFFFPSEGRRWFPNWVRRDRNRDRHGRNDGRRDHRDHRDRHDRHEHHRDWH